jgi:LCP family protein required for cell wall assembly
MAKITSASQLGGVDLLKQTILYNFGVPIHYHARVDFEGFQEIVDAIGGVDIAVDCELTSWRLKSPDLDPEEEDNWELFTLEPGVHHMDGDLALWYARARKGVPLADWDRGRRQQKLLRALFNQGIDLNLVAQVPSLWEAFRNTVETDIDIGRVLQLAALAPAVRENGIQHLYLAGKTRGGTIVTEEGVELSVNYPVWEGEGMMQDTFARLSRPPALNRSTGPAITVEIVNGSGDEDMAVLAADNLAWYGFAPTVSTETPEEPVESTTLTYFGPNFKGAYEWIISWIFHMDAEDIIIKEGDASPYNYQVILGQDYDSCLQNQIYYSP